MRKWCHWAGPLDGFPVSAEPIAPGVQVELAGQPLGPLLIPALQRLDPQRQLLTVRRTGDIKQDRGERCPQRLRCVHDDQPIQDRQDTGQQMLGKRGSVRNLDDQREVLKAAFAVPEASEVVCHVRFAQHVQRDAVEVESPSFGEMSREQPSSESVATHELDHGPVRLRPTAPERSGARAQWRRPGSS